MTTDKWKAVLEKCGWTYSKVITGRMGHDLYSCPVIGMRWVHPSENNIQFRQIPPPTLDNIFKWPIQEIRYSSKVNFKQFLCDWVDSLYLMAETQDEAKALVDCCYEVLCK